MTASAQGVDTSSYQQPLDVTVLHSASLSFAFAKATNGTSPEDPAFAASWDAIAEAGIQRGAYHELTPEDPEVQALHFMTVVMNRGLRPGDMLACVASDYPVTGAQAKRFLDSARSIAGPKCPVLLYSDVSALPGLAECDGYPLWIAYFADAAPESVAPWAKWTFWQYQAGGGADGGDRDAFNGTTAQLGVWVASYVHAVPPVIPAWQEALMQVLPTVREGSAGGIVRTVQGLLCARGYTVVIDGDYGQATATGVEDAQRAAGIGVDGIVGAATWPVLVGVA